MSYESKDKMVSHPAHYQSGKFEVIDIIEEFTKDLTGIEAVDTGNAIKYVLRWHKKNGRQDLEKAIWYLTHLVQHLIDQEQAEGRHEISDVEYYKSVRAEKDPERSTSGERKVCGTCKYSDDYDFWDNSVKCSIYLGRKNHEEQHDCWEENKFDIEDEPAPLNLHKNSLGIYIPDDPVENNCDWCKYEKTQEEDEPCNTCIARACYYGDTFSMFEPKEDTAE